MYDFIPRVTASARARWWLFQPNLVVVDTETTGLDDAEVVEVAAVDSRANVLFHSYIQPYNYIPRDAIDVHGITNGKVADAPTFRQVYPQLKKVLEGALVVMYNADFDNRVLHNSARRWHCPPIAIESECAMLTYAEWCGDWSDYHQSYRWKKLTDAANLFRLNTEGAHGALKDALMTLGVIKGMATHLSK